MSAETESPGQLDFQSKRTKDEEQASAELRASRRAALNLLEDAVAARQEAERAGARLRESEEKYRNLFENMTEEVHFWKVVRDASGQIKTWRLVDANPPTLKSWGRKTVEEIKGKTTDEIFGPGAAEHYLPVVNKVMTEGVPHVYEDFFPNLDKHFRFTTVPLGEYFITTGADITSIKKAHEALHQKVEEFQTVMDVAPVAIWVSRDPQCNEIVGNRTADQFYEAREGENVSAGPAAGQMVPPRRFFRNGRELTAADLPMQEATAKNVTVPAAELEVELPSGRRMTMYGGASPLLDADGKVRGCVGAFLDITMLKQAEEAQRLSEEKFAKAFAGNPAALALTRLDDGLFVEVNDSWVAMSGFSREEAVGRFARKMNIWPSVEAAAGFAQELREKGSVRQREQQFRKKSGEFYTAELSAQILNMGGENIILSTLVDVTARKQAENALQTTLQRFYAVLSSMYSAVLLLTDEGQVEFTNQAFCDQFGLKDAPAGLAALTSREIIEKIKNGYLHPDEAVARIREIVEQRQPVKGEEIATQNGGACLRDFVPLDIQGKPCGRLWVHYDITARKRAEEEVQKLLSAVREEKDRLSSLLNSMTDEVWFADTDKHFTLANPSAVREFGLSSSNGGNVAKLAASLEVYRSDGSLRPVEETPPLRALAGEVIRGEEEIIRTPGTGELRYGQVSSAPVRDIKGHIIGSVSVVRDVTERKRAEEALRRNAALLSQAERLAGVGSWEWDISSGELNWSEQTYRMFGFLPGQVTPSYDLFIGHVHSEDRPLVRQAIEEAVAGRRPYDMEYRIVAEAGDTRWLYTRGEVARDAGGRAMRMIGAAVDITERKRGEEALRDLNLSLEQRVTERTAEVQHQADQLRALAVELSQAEQRERKRLSAILHDHIQQLLVAAQLQVGLIERADPRTIRSTVQGINSIIAEAIAASRSLTVELSPPILHQSGLTAALTWLAARKEEKYLFKVHVRANSDAEPANPDVRAMLFESVRELLLNAVKHSGVREAQLIMRRTKEDWTQIIVEDKGKGFDPSAISAHRGGGFGLFSIQQRLAYLGGRLEVESAPGHGARFVLMIPIGKAAAAESAAAATAPPSEPALARPKSRKISVLLVDDHRIVRQGLSSLLEFEEDIEVVGEAENGRQAVDLARQHSPEVVIMDVNMPIMGGIEATQILSREMPQVKVIGLSMHAERDTAEAMRQAGAVAYLTKGGPSEDLIAAIRACRTDRRGDAG